jgi:hypothetical protein
MNKEEISEFLKSHSEFECTDRGKVIQYLKVEIGLFNMGLLASVQMDGT